MTTTKTSRTFTGVRNYHFETHNKDNKLKKRALTEKDWRKKVESDFEKLTKKIDLVQLTYIFHDKDEDSLHCHFVIQAKNMMKLSTIQKLTRTDQYNDDFHCQIADKLANSILYLTHETDRAKIEEKHLYERAELSVYAKYPKKSTGALRELSNDEIEAWFEKETKSAQQGSQQAKNSKKDEKEFVQLLQWQLRNGEIALQGDLADGIEGAETKLIEKYGGIKGYNIFQQNRERFKRCADDFLNQKLEKRAINKKPLKSIIFSGSSNLGKTRFMKGFAQFVAEKENDDSIHLAPSSASNKTYDFAQNYQGELQTIFDDLKPNSFGYDEFKNIFTRDSQAVWATVRNTNKKWSADYAYITTDYQPDKFAEKLAQTRLSEEGSEEGKQNILDQIYTRITVYFELRKYGYTIKIYDISDGWQIIKEDSFDNISDFYDKKYQKEIFEFLYKELKNSEKERDF